MLTVLSPSKKLLNVKIPYSKEITIPKFKIKTEKLVQILKKLSVSNLGKLMHLSEDLAELNYFRYKNFTENGEARSGYPAIFLFQGDVYQYLNAKEWSEETLHYAESHLVILSGLYGLLKPLDLIQPYRLEMGTKLPNASGKNLYAFWQEKITEELNTRLALHENPLLINLASTEYFKAINIHQLKAPILTIHFKEQQGSQFKVIGIHAKKARGAMANYINQHQIDDVAQLKNFTLLNYHFCEKSSDQENFNFVRNSRK